MIAANGGAYEVQCRHCSVVYHIIANRADMEAWKNKEGYIQDVLGYLSAGERELLISGTCNNCWRNMFGSDEEDDDEV